ncbi:hypothetical protein ACFOWA_06690 [Pedobacter lithocola]|uniref:Uncharacterized protein n=1 Tax=Pedobacter lithocola TaxID=1908239 RepID=A0ABV8P6F3_9SPHI
MENFSTIPEIKYIFQSLYLSGDIEEFYHEQYIFFLLKNDFIQGFNPFDEFEKFGIEVLVKYLDDDLLLKDEYRKFLFNETDFVNQEIDKCNFILQIPITLSPNKKVEQTSKNIKYHKIFQPFYDIKTLFTKLDPDDIDTPLLNENTNMTVKKYFDYLSDKLIELQLSSNNIVSEQQKEKNISNPQLTLKDVCYEGAYKELIKLLENNILIEPETHIFLDSKSNLIGIFKEIKLKKYFYRKVNVRELIIIAKNTFGLDITYTYFTQIPTGGNTGGNDGISLNIPIYQNNK